MIDLKKEPPKLVGSLLTGAVHDNNKPLVELFIANKANINLLDKNGNNALHEACRLNLFGMVKLLIEKDGNLKKHNKERKTPYKFLEKDNELHNYIVNLLMEKDLLGPVLNSGKILNKIYTDITEYKKRETLQHILEEKLHELQNNKIMNTIIEITNCANIKIFLSTMSCSSETYTIVGKYYHSSNNIAVFNVDSQLANKIISTLMHEFTHLVNKIKFKNNADPFHSMVTEKKKGKLTELGKSLLEVNDLSFKPLKTYEDNKFSSEIPAFFIEMLVTAILENKKISYNNPIKKTLAEEMYEIFHNIDPKMGLLNSQKMLFFAKNL